MSPDTLNGIILLTATGLTAIILALHCYGIAEDREDREKENPGRGSRGKRSNNETSQDYHE